MKKWFYLLIAVIFVQSLMIVGLAAALYARETHMELMRENRELQTLIRERTETACAIRIRLGSAYKTALEQLMDHLGLEDNPLSPTEAVLTAYEAAGVGGAE